ncbi:SH3 domain-containing protein [Anaerolineales bacterium HSG6]|nr:SH3 domain-containing protein [Anaerolineales bacterium HSG6]MDM8529782.1 SH3 domain-containing protein [Anaerolineales bacterium HSG25]
MNWYDQKTRRTRRPRRIEEEDSAEIGFPILWVLIGLLAAMLIIGLVSLGALNLLRRQAITPTPPFIAGLAPTQPILDAPISDDGTEATPTIPPVVTLPPTVTPIPSATPVPQVPKTIEIGGFARIVNTDGYGVSMRAGPGTNNARLEVIPENANVEIKDGPRESENLEDYIWWFVIAPNGEEGWIATDFLEPSIGPNR